VACGSSFWVKSKTAGNVLTLAPQKNTTECALMQLAGVYDCSRCGVLVPGVNYTVYMAAATSKAKTTTHVFQVRSCTSLVQGCRGGTTCRTQLFVAACKSGRARRAIDGDCDTMACTQRVT
jgi:hypothetical protein